MSVLYSVLSFAELARMERSELDASLSSFSLEYPPHAERSRNPTQQEIENAIRIFTSEEFAVEFYPSDQDSVDTPWSSVVVKHPNDPYWYMDITARETPCDKKTPCGVYFVGKPEMNFRVLERLAHHCGPLLSIANGEFDAVIFHYKDSTADPPPTYCQGHSFLGNR